MASLGSLFAIIISAIASFFGVPSASAAPVTPASVVSAVSDAFATVSHMSSTMLNNVQQPQSSSRPASRPAARPAAKATIHATAYGTQSMIDTCPRNGFTRTTDVEKYMGVPYLSAHNYCGGDVILGLKKGDIVNIKGNMTGTYRVAGYVDISQLSMDVNDVPRGYDAYLQTCYYDKLSVKVVMLSKI